MAKKITPIIQHNAKTESFKRPNHPDFHTTEEHRKNEFTGIRKNDLVLQYEFWILGKIEKTVSFEEVAKNKFALEQAHIELFHMAAPKGALLQ